MKQSCANCRYFNATDSICKQDLSETRFDFFCVSWSAMDASSLPEGDEAFNAMKAALWKKANGYQYEQKTEIDGPKGATTITKIVDVPGDVRAMETYIKLFGG